jgi:2-C-methyl-D-erythritol 4-phosphate cytidylyltransferase/2-C-methyl-D-erythritol 2,4-cyclodiphosphate synthase
MLGDRWVLQRAVDALQHCPRIDEIVVVVREEHMAEVRRRLGGKVTAVVAGGSERRQSVAAGLDAVPAADWIVVHDGARPFVSGALVVQVLDAAQRWGAATAGLPVTDTVKRVEDGRVRTTVDRSDLVAVQTPQAFRAGLLREAHRRVPAEVAATDDAELVERLGGEVIVVPGDPANVKVTTPSDLALARRRAGEAIAGEVRVGVGYDVHRLVPGRDLVLGGVRIPHPRGLEGHSDADAIAHAITDALLGAAGRRDIGFHFPPDDPAYRGADSLSLLGSVVEQLRSEGWAVVNVDAVVMAEAPALAPFVDEMRQRIAAAAGIGPGQVGVKATSGEGLGPVGRGEGIAAHAVALLLRTSEP